MLHALARFVYYFLLGRRVVYVGRAYQALIVSTSLWRVILSRPAQAQNDLDALKAPARIPNSTFWKRCNNGEQITDLAEFLLGQSCSFFYIFLREWGVLVRFHSSWGLWKGYRGRKLNVARALRGLAVAVRLSAFPTFLLPTEPSSHEVRCWRPSVV